MSSPSPRENRKLREAAKAANFARIHGIQPFSIDLDQLRTRMIRHNWRECGPSRSLSSRLGIRTWECLNCGRRTDEEWQSRDPWSLGTGRSGYILCRDIPALEVLDE